MTNGIVSYRFSSLMFYQQ